MSYDIELLLMCRACKIKWMRHLVNTNNNKKITNSIAIYSQKNNLSGNLKNVFLLSKNKKKNLT